MQGFYSKLDAVPLLGAGGGGPWGGRGAWGGGGPGGGRGPRSLLPLSLAVETEKAQALLQTFSSASLLASAGSAC
ncbi:hypothetical protein CgunFtcFv8_025621 [Champsocephalus gunnari]|uniref:Uncharacterized protein n=1 Tax=Champsocephalus gunnari TaxID=52237 RepID=A0AAN8H2I0_CHAGU|nr:hypothetical protein CgunFtcFv8_025621 [Champsocephalus gunnari]